MEKGECHYWGDNKQYHKHRAATSRRQQSHMAFAYTKVELKKNHHRTLMHYKQPHCYGFATAKDINFNGETNTSLVTLPKMSIKNAGKIMKDSHIIKSQRGHKLHNTLHYCACKTALLDEASNLCHSSMTQM